MADPLSVAGLALAVVSLGLQVTGGITDYFDSLKSRDQDIASIIQQNDTLKKTLQVIESSISRFQNDHRTATEALRQFLDSSNDELKVLEGMVAMLTTDDQGSTNRRTKARNKGKKLLYPFHRPKLEQMATKLHHINATLQLGLQSLGLDLLVVQSEVSSISSPIRGMQNTLSHFETRFDGLEHLLEQLLVQGSNTNEKLQDITPALVTGRLLGKPAVLREMCDAVVAQEQHKPERNPPVPHEREAKVRTDVSNYTGGRFSCLCRHRRHVHHWNAALGSFVLSHETTTERHLPGCPVTRAILEPDRSQKIALTYAGLRRLLNSAIQFSLTIRSGAGGSSFGPNFTYYPIVDSNRAPAFKMLRLLMRCFQHNGYLTFYSYSEVPAFSEKLIPSVVSAVLSLLQAKQASPRAVNDRNESLVYSVAECEVITVTTLSERNLFGQTPLHLAADKPSILRVLVDAADIALLNLTDNEEFSALDLAVSVSGTNCREGRTRMCKRCRCAECAVILMKADCMIPTSSLESALDYASKRSRLRYLRYMKGRRDRLKRLGLENLPKTDLDQLCLESKHVLDSDAFEVTQRLQQTGICVPEALAVMDYKWPRSVYQLINSCDDADLLFRVGFRDTASWCDADDVERWAISSPRETLSYLRWLANHDGIYCRLPFPTVKDIFGSACIFSAIGCEIRRFWTRSRSRYGQYNQSNGDKSLLASPTMDPEEEDWYHEVHSAVFEARAVDSCSCQCSPGGCNMLTFILCQLVNETQFEYKPRRYSQDDTTTDIGSGSIWVGENSLLKLIDGFIVYLSHFSFHFQRWHHSATIRFITFAALEIGHSCCRRDNLYRLLEDDIDSDENGLGDDQVYKLELLEDLINEFEETMTSVLENPDTGTDELIDFWERTWVERMSEVLDCLEGSDLPEDEKLAAEEIGVVWDKVGPEPPEPRPEELENPYRMYMIEYRLYELRKIEEECQ
ncbi:hypothetical protein FPRO03_00072 [Fusarium proliferatum]|nr:hypothetical protein FPRO03_00072 [Fusarium proliferatum]